MDANWTNRALFHGDNLDFMRAMNSASVDLIATDPPFNKSKDFHATPDSLAKGASFQDRWSWEKDVHQEWVDQLTDDHPALIEAIESAMHAHSEGMGAYMCFMAVRLLAMHRILKPTGSIYLHCDPTASHYLKAVMDAIFGWRNFRNEIVWRRTGSHNSADRFGPIHDILLFYSKSENYTWNNQKQPYMIGHVDEHFVPDNGGYKTAYFGNVLTGSGIRGGLSGQPWKGINPTAKDRHWAIPGKLWEDSGIDGTGLNQREKLDALFDAGLIKIEDGAAWPIYERRIREDDGPAVGDIWAYQPYTKGCLYGTDAEIDIEVRWISPTDKKERTGYPTQKPLALYGRIIKASSNKDDIVLDPFAGCATTCVAAEKLNRRWVGIDIWDKAHEVVVQRLHDTVGLFGEVHYTKDLPERTDEGQTAAPHLKVKQSVPEPPGRKMSRQEMYDILLSQQGIKCQGCGRKFDDKRYLELDHNTPRADGGPNHISNRILLCGPCNRLKSHIYTLSGLRRENENRGFMRG